LLARTAGRRHEMAVRLAIGAGRVRLIRQLLAESLLLASIGGGLGVLIAHWSTAMLVTFLPQGSIPIVLILRPDARMLAFTAGVVLLTAVLFGLAPALQAVRPDVIPALKRDDGRKNGRPGWTGHALIIAQVAMAVVLIVTAALFLRSLTNLRAVDLGH